MLNNGWTCSHMWILLEALASQHMFLEKYIYIEINGNV